jgi:hypothetical protein
LWAERLSYGVEEGATAMTDRETLDEIIDRFGYEEDENNIRSYTLPDLRKFRDRLLALCDEWQKVLDTGCPCNMCKVTKSHRCAERLRALVRRKEPSDGTA